MEFRTRHMAIFLYSGLAAVILVKDMITTPEMALALIAPLVGMFTWDKIDQSRKSKTPA
jgi:hypothetical protein